jgi:hypothetical protein
MFLSTCSSPGPTLMLPFKWWKTASDLMHKPLKGIHFTCAQVSWISRGVLEQKVLKADTEQVEDYVEKRGIKKSHILSYILWFASFLYIAWHCRYKHGGITFWKPFIFTRSISLLQQTIIFCKWDLFLYPINTVHFM